ncbi:hypothetical protein [Nocardia cyriacigeorgica]|uniref:hypothetical protein n=1 Tax=Nocardia cyriacigeorgica TaxID=135487 RepID=UPI002454C784|nr:hypothetical protein [Nocardia cyriacigeorgica]
MTATAEPDGLAEFAVELKLLAEAVLERVEPVLRRAAADGKPEWDNCSWCPVCAAAALVRGEQHDVLSAIADHGTAIVTVLREALAGVPVEPVMPEGSPEHGVRHRHHSARPEAAEHPAADRVDSVPRGGPDTRGPATSAAAEPGPGDIGPTDGDTGTGSDSPGAGEATDPGGRESATGNRTRARYVGIPVTIKT